MRWVGPGRVILLHIPSCMVSFTIHFPQSVKCNSTCMIVPADLLQSCHRKRMWTRCWFLGFRKSRNVADLEMTWQYTRWSAHVLITRPEGKNENELGTMQGGLRLPFVSRCVCVCVCACVWHMYMCTLFWPMSCTYRCIRLRMKLFMRAHPLNHPLNQPAPPVLSGINTLHTSWNWAIYFFISPNVCCSFTIPKMFGIFIQYGFRRLLAGWWSVKIAGTVKPALNDHRFKRPPAFSDRFFKHGESAIQTALC